VTVNKYRLTEFSGFLTKKEIAPFLYFLFIWKEFLNYHFLKTKGAKRLISHHKLPSIKINTMVRTLYTEGSPNELPKTVNLLF
jgi:hypothetical protein